MYDCIKLIVYYRLQNAITKVTIHYEKLVHLKDVIGKLQDQIDVKPLLYVCEQHAYDTFKLKNNLATKEMRLIAFQKQFNKYSNVKNDIESSLSAIKSNLDTDMSQRKTVDINVRVFVYLMPYYA